MSGRYRSVTANSPSSDRVDRAPSGLRTALPLANSCWLRAGDFPVRQPYGAVICSRGYAPRVAQGSRHAYAFIRLIR